jgi:hypothetical protein
MLTISAGDSGDSGGLYIKTRKKSKVINDNIRSEVAVYRTAVDRVMVTGVERIVEPVCMCIIHTGIRR